MYGPLTFLLQEDGAAAEVMLGHHNRTKMLPAGCSNTTSKI